MLSEALQRAHGIGGLGIGENHELGLGAGGRDELAAFAFGFCFRVEVGVTFLTGRIYPGR